MLRLFTFCLLLLLLPDLLPAARAQSSYALLPAQGLPNFSTLSRGPDGSQLFHRAAIIYPAADIQGVAAGTSFTSLGFQLRTPAAGPATGTLRLWLRHTTDANYSLAADWAYLLLNPVAMTQVYDGPLTIPAAAGWFDLTLQTPFTYQGGGLYVAYEWVATTTSATAAAYECNADRAQSIRVSTGSTAPTQLTQASNFRPVLRLGY